MTADQPRPTLVEFLLARLGEDEALARAAAERGSTEHWRVSDDFPGPTPHLASEWQGDDVSMSSQHFLAILGGVAAHIGDVLPHIARHDPARVLTDVEAKRRIIARMTMLRRLRPGDLAAEVCADGTLCALALPYADHPDCDERWRA